MRPLTRPVATGCCLLFTLVSATACLFAYNSRWAQRRAERERAVQHYSGAKLENAPGASKAKLRRQHITHFTIRALASPRHATEVVHWQQQLRATVAHANRVLRAECGLELEVVDTGSWTPTGARDDLHALLSQLKTVDPAEDVQFVVGLVESTPKLESSLHKIGSAFRFGKHLVMRAPKAHSYDFIEEGFKEVSDRERRRLHDSRKQHRATVVLLHELGHALGAIHAPDPKRLMFPGYRPDQRGYGELTAAFLWRSAQERARPPAERDGEKLVRGFLEELQRRPEWPDQERAAWTKYLTGLLHEHGQPPTMRRATRVPPTSEPKSVSKPPAASHLQSEHRAVFEAARAAHKAARNDEAWQLGQPLFSAYPDDYAVQELRCQIAVARELGWQAIRSECARMMELVPGLSKTLDGKR